MKFLFCISLIVVLFSCEDSMYRVAEPEQLIPRDTMVLVLKDLTLIETYIQSQYIHVSRYQKIMKLSGKKVLDKYHLSDKRFEQSMDYYGSRQEEMASIYTQVLDSLNKEASMLSKDLPKFDSTKFQQPNVGLERPL